MSDDEKLMSDALAALTCSGEDDDPGHRCTHCDDYVDRNGPLRAALRERLAQPRQWQGLTDEQADSIINGLRTCLHLDSKRMFLKTWLRDWAAHGMPAFVLDAYRIETEFFGLDDNAQDHPKAEALYRLAKQPAQQQEPLTHPQIHELDWPDGVSFEDILPFVRAIEAAHGIKE